MNKAKVVIQNTFRVFIIQLSQKSDNQSFNTRYTNFKECSTIKKKEEQKMYFFWIHIFSQINLFNPSPGLEGKKPRKKCVNMDSNF